MERVPHRRLQLNFIEHLVVEGRQQPTRALLTGALLLRRRDSLDLGIDGSRVVVLLRPQQGLGRLVRIGLTRFG